MVTKTTSSSSSRFGDSLRSTNRRRIKTKLFLFDCEVCLLDFIGANQYLITDFGEIWERQNIYTNTFGILTRGCLPTVRRDPEFPYPWVLLKTSMGTMWFPVNQLLGWAFKPNADKNMKYYLSDTISNPMHVKDFRWVDKIECSEDSLYKKFIDEIYS